MLKLKKYIYVCTNYMKFLYILLNWLEVVDIRIKNLKKQMNEIGFTFNTKFWNEFLKINMNSFI